MQRGEGLPGQIERSDDEVRESMWIEVVKQTESMYADLANSHTEIERKDRELRASKAFTENVIRSMKNALVVGDEKGHIKVVNDAVSALLGYSKNELAGQGIDTLFAPSELRRKNVRNSLDPHKSPEGVLDRESAFITRSGERIPVAYSCSPLKDDEENVVGMVMVAQDLRRTKSLIRKAARAAKAYRDEAVELEKAYEELQQLQDSLIRSEKLAYLGKLAAGIAHEINNPLTSVLAISSFLLPKIAGDDSLKEDLQIIVEETKRCKKIVEELLEFSRQREPEKSLVNLNQLVEATLIVIEKQHFFHNIVIVREYMEQLPEIMADRNQIKQVFMNLILNAQEAMPDGGTLTVRSGLTADLRFVEIRFCDAGHGIHKEDIPKLFDPFFTTKHKAKGTGLGLSVSQGITTRHGGTIEVTSILGQGATFTVKLPVKKGN